MHNIIIVSRNGMEGSEVQEQARVEAEKLSDIIIDLQHIWKKVAVERVKKLLEKLFQNEFVMEALKRRVGTTALQKRIVDENEKRLFSNRFYMRIGQLGQLYFTYYATETISVLKMQFSLVDRRQLRNSP